MMEILVGIIGSGLISWWITHVYYKRSMKQQSNESQKEIEKLVSILEKQSNNNHEVLVARILEESIQDYRHAGTPVRVLDSYTSLTNEEKADLYDRVMLRVKGRLGKSNKYKTNKNI
jgi:hypothetical protein